MVKLPAQLIHAVQVIYKTYMVMVILLQLRIANMVNFFDQMYFLLFFIEYLCSPLHEGRCWS